MTSAHFERIQESQSPYKTKKRQREGTLKNKSAPEEDQCQPRLRKVFPVTHQPNHDKTDTRPHIDANLA